MELPEQHPLRVTLSLAAVVLALWAGSGILVFRFSESPGVFGDTFGAINALFSGLAFAGVIYAILLQRQELRLQRDELTLTRAELAGQRLALAAQNETLRNQNFETTFFQLLRVLTEIVSGMDIRENAHRPDVARGRDCFSVFYRVLGSRWNDDSSKAASSDAERIKRVYADFYARHESDLGHYFRTLYNLVKFVDRSDVSDKRLYTNLIRAQLSSHELLLIFYNCISDMGEDKFKPLVEKYGLLKTLPRRRLLNPPNHLPLYGMPAYGQDGATS